MNENENRPVSNLEASKNESRGEDQENPQLASKDLAKDEKSKEKISQKPEEKPDIDLKRIDLNALWVVRRLRAKGHEAYLTGGCVRDLLLGEEPKDFDVATSAKPEEVKAVFRNCRLIGRRFLLAHVVFPGGKIIETATFRANPSDESNNEEDSDDLLVMQDNVYGTMKEDAFRRDLTINGLFYDPVEGKVIDYVGGRDDLKNGVIRTIGDPEIRLQEDPVRILRAIRFANRLGFTIEENTLKNMCEFSKELLRCAPARLQEEIVKLLTRGQAQKSLTLAFQIGVLDSLMPELMQGLGVEIQNEISDLRELPSENAAFDYWQNILRALDELSSRDCCIMSSVAFTALLLPAYTRLEESDTNERNWIDKLCVNWAERIRLTRKDQDLLRILLSAIPLFALEKIQQKSSQYLVRKPWFKEGLLAYVIHLCATNESLEQVKLWKTLAHDAQKPYVQDRFSLRSTTPRFRKRRMPFGNAGKRRFRQQQRG